MNHDDTNATTRKALRLFRYNLFVLTCGQGSQAHAATISWVTQVSFAPRRLAIAVRKDSHIYPVLRQHGMFALNLVGEGQQELASAFFKYVAANDHDIAGYPVEAGHATGAPLFLDTPAWLECCVVEEANATGDHGLFVADVLVGGVRSESPQPLDLSTTHWVYAG